MFWRIPVPVGCVCLNFLKNDRATRTCSVLGCVFGWLLHSVRWLPWQVVGLGRVEASTPMCVQHFSQAPSTTKGMTATPTGQTVLQLVQLFNRHTHSPHAHSSHAYSPQASSGKARKGLGKTCFPEWGSQPTTGSQALLAHSTPHSTQAARPQNSNPKPHRPCWLTSTVFKAHDSNTYGLQSANLSEVGAHEVKLQLLQQPTGSQPTSLPPEEIRKGSGEPVGQGETHRLTGPHRLTGLAG